MAEAEVPEGTQESDSQTGTEEFTPPKDGSWLPKVRVDEMVGEAKDRSRRAEQEAQAVRVELAELRGQIKATPKPPTEQRASRQTLRAAVEEGKITQDKMDEIVEMQFEDRLRQNSEELKQEFASQAVTLSKDQTVDREIEKYVSAFPQLGQDGSEQDLAAGAEYKKFLSFGMPENRATKLAALRATLGPAEKIPEKTAGSRETHQETGGSGGGSSTGSSDNGAPKGTPKRLADYYSKAIEKGMYSGWDDKHLKAELKSAASKSE